MNLSSYLHDVDRKQEKTRFLKGMICFKTRRKNITFRIRASKIERTAIPSILT